MHAPWIRDMQESEKNVSKGFRWTVAIICAGMVALAIFFLTSCSHLTVAPKLVTAKSVAFDENQQNAGIIDCGRGGCLVTPNWMAKYKQMEVEFKNTVAADTNIKPEGANFRISFEVLNHFLALKSSERGP